MNGTRDRLRLLGCAALMLLIACTLAFDFLHGVRLGQNHVAFHPIYRLRQSLAVAISQLRDPPLGRYLAYGSVVNVLNENGFKQFDNEVGQQLDQNGWERLLTDGPRLDRIIADAMTVRIDETLPPQVIGGNEIGLADYIVLSFRLFGDKVSSLYYFYFLILIASCLLYALQFRNSPFLLFLLAVYLAETFYFEIYAHNYGLQLETPANSRLFSGLSLLPAVHVLLVLWRRLPFRPFTAAAVVLQSLVVAFLLSCRTEVAWQVAMIVVVALVSALVLLLRPAADKDGGRLRRLTALWPAAAFVLVISLYSAAITLRADERYRVEPEGHIVWHEVLLGILRASPDLLREYTGHTVWGNDDEEVYVAILRDLEARRDFSSPIVRRAGDGHLGIDFFAGYREYDRLARALALRIIVHHPVAVLATIPVKIGEQVEWYDNARRHTMTWDAFRAPVVMVAVAALMCLAAGGFVVDLSGLGSAVTFAAIVLLFASVTPLIEPSAMSIGSLFSYLGAVAVAACFLAALLLQGLSRLVFRSGIVSRAQSA